MQGLIDTIETLLTNVQVHIIGFRKFSTNSSGGYDGQDNNRQDIENREEGVLTMIGYAKQYACDSLDFMPGQTCIMTEMRSSTGTAYADD